MRRMLDPTKVGGLPSTIEFDKDGNRKVNKNLGVEGKFTLKSLVSDTNPDGDITKELGGGGGGGVVKIIAHSKSVAFNLEAKAYNSGDIGGYSTFDVASDLAPVARNSIYKENDCVFLIQPILKKESVSNEWRIALVCIVGGTISAPSTFTAKLNTFSLTQS